MSEEELIPENVDAIQIDPALAELHSIPLASDQEPTEMVPPISSTDLQVQKECIDLFSSTDYIMEPTIFDTIKTYFMHGGEPGPIVDLLSDNYTAVAQTVNLLAEWLILTGVPVQEVQLMVENHLKNLIMKHFDPKKADTIFNLEGGAPTWLTEMIEHSIWRKMLYKLAEQHPNCLMLNFTIKVIQLFLQILFSLLK